MDSKNEFLSDVFKSVDEYEDIDEEIFDKILRSNAPAIVKNISFGDCIHKWNLNYLNQKLRNSPIVIHESTREHLDFIAKNFTYKTCTFQEFVDKIGSTNSYVYLRSTNSNPRAKKPARIEEDFPSIASDFKPAKFIPHGDDNNLYHSSVLRIASSKVQIWTHFDLYDNILCQVYGTKRVILLPPEDSKYLYVDGDKSKVNNFDDWEQCSKQFPLMRQAKPHRCILRPGDSLFIPAIWWHNIKTISDMGTIGDHSIGFNIFWKDKELDEKSLYGDRDVYGNKNLKPFDAALANIRRAVELLDKLPRKYRTIYRLMLLEKFKKDLSLDS